VVEEYQVGLVVWEWHEGLVTLVDHLRVVRAMVLREAVQWHLHLIGKIFVKVAEMNFPVFELED